MFLTKNGRLLKKLIEKTEDGTIEWERRGTWDNNFLFARHCGEGLKLYMDDEGRYCALDVNDARVCNTYDTFGLFEGNLMKELAVLCFGNRQLNTKTAVEKLLEC